jgi:NitT/TauT family transport system permease protein
MAERLTAQKELHRQRIALLAFVCVVVGAWQIASLQLPSYVLAGPVLVVKRLYEFVTTYALARHAIISLTHVVVALLIAFLVGNLLAFLAFYVRIFEFAVHQRISAATNSFPGIGWIILAIMWFGVGSVTVIFAIAISLLPFVLINLREGFGALGADSLEMSRSFTRRGFRTFYLIILPSLYPFMFATLRIVFGVAWKITLTAELFGGRGGLGYLFNRARQNYDTALILVVILIIIAFVYSVDRLVFRPIQQRLERQHD